MYFNGHDETQENNGVSNTKQCLISISWVG